MEPIPKAVVELYGTKKIEPIKYIWALTNDLCKLNNIMITVEQQYLEVLERLVDGHHQENRTDTAAYKIPPVMLQHDMSDGFPLLTTKRVAWKTMKVELEGFIKGITSKKWFQDRGCSIWSEWSYIDGRALTHGEESRYLYQEQSDDLGVIYGFQWNNYNGEKDYNPPVPNVKHFPMLESIDGKTHESNNYGEFIVTGESGRMVDIQFLYNGYSTTVSKSNMKRGMVKNPYYPVYYGAGCLGCPDKTNPYHTKAKSVWTNMITRCYDKENKDYHRYGGNGVFVSNDWLVYEYFLEDITKIENWENKQQNWGGYSLDKDHKQQNTEFKKYSLETCVWEDKKTQSTHRDVVLKFKAISPDGVVFDNQTNLVSFCKERGVDSSDANRRLNGKYKWKPKGWEFVKIDGVKPKEPLNQFRNIVETLKSNPTDRRMICMAWNPMQNESMALPPCHYGFQITVRGNKLDLTWQQRSVDTLLGLPFNLASYALLLHLFAKEAGMEEGVITGMLCDVHLYDNHVEQAREQLSRTPKELPTIDTPDFTNIFEWDHTQTVVNGYDPHSPIKAPVAV